MKQSASRARAPNLARSTTLEPYCTDTQYGAATDALRQRLRACGRKANRRLQIVRPHGDLELPGDWPARPAYGHARRTRPVFALSELPAQQCRGACRECRSASEVEPTLNSYRSRKHIGLGGWQIARDSNFLCPRFSGLVFVPPTARIRDRTRLAVLMHPWVMEKPRRSTRAKQI